MIGEPMIIHAAVRLAVDDAGQDLVEYALLSGIIGVAGVLLFPLIADGMRTAYLSWTGGASNVWVPCDPAPASCP